MQNKRKYFFQIGFPALALLLLISGALVAQEIVDPEILAAQKDQQKKAEEAGYADIEIDHIHKDLATLTTALKGRLKRAEVNNGGEQPDIYFQIAAGESIKAISERYVYDGYIKIYLAGENKIGKIEFQFTRTNPLGATYKEERRILVNPSPNFSDNLPNQIDRNDDMTITYFEKTKPEAGFEKIYETNVKDIPFFDKRVRLVETYKKYIRRARYTMTNKSKDLNLSERVKIQHMLEFE